MTVEKETAGRRAIWGVSSVIQGVRHSQWHHQHSHWWHHLHPFPSQLQSSAPQITIPLVECHTAFSIMKIKTRNKKTNIINKRMPHKLKLMNRSPGVSCSVVVFVSWSVTFFPLRTATEFVTFERFNQQNEQSNTVHATSTATLKRIKSFQKYNLKCTTTQVKQ